MFFFREEGEGGALGKATRVRGVELEGNRKKERRDGRNGGKGQ